MANGKDIFGYKRSRKAEGVFSTDGSWLTFDNNRSVQGYLVQSWNIAYNQDVVEVFELGSNALYWSKGRPTGAGSLSRIVGIKDASSGTDTDTGLFPPEAYDVCKGGALFRLSAAGGSCPPEGNLKDVGARGVKLEMDGCIVTSIGFSANVADTRLMEAINWRFGFLTVEAVESGGDR